MLPRSLRSDEKAYYVRYQKLHKDNFVDANTYKTHPWIALDMETKDRLHIEKSYIYNPKTSREFLQERFPNKEIPENFETRIRAFITLPVYTLKYRTLLEIRNQFENTDDIDKLELPKQLAEDLKRTIEYRNSQMQMDVSEAME
ncbi:hypothetical protein NQ318_000912 [Aromia moschata]|uniref:Uncharacterized protein n=1 Tax=Aromia moschata TaxID=1265417 RepID=A0AAV8ZFK2_9CUCU|nr:hypothetical protein NQ318_000912 [Aromia moschata]